MRILEPSDDFNYKYPVEAVLRSRISIPEPQQTCMPACPPRLPGQESVCQRRPQRSHECCFVLGPPSAFGRLERPSADPETKGTRRAGGWAIGDALERTGHLARLPSGHSDFNEFSYLMEKNSSGPCSMVTELFACIKRVGFLHINPTPPHVPFPRL